MKCLGIVYATYMSTETCQIKPLLSRGLSGHYCEQRVLLLLGMCYLPSNANQISLQSKACLVFTVRDYFAKAESGQPEGMAS